ncbi:MAG: mercury(II) reductase [Acidimicrobiia bacterium]
MKTKREKIDSPGEPIRLSIEGMTCDHCEITVGKALSRAGLQDPQVDWQTGTAVGVATAVFSTDRATTELANDGYGLVQDDEPGSERLAESPSDGDHDLLIIGSGSAAFAAAIKASELGARVAMVERGTVGGTCVNVGCVPSKALLRAAEHYHRAGRSPFAGLPTAVGSVDLAALVAQKDDLVNTMRREKYEDLIDVYGIDLIRGEARFTGPDTVEVDGRVVSAGRYLIATGAAPWTPPIAGLNEVGYLTSTTALGLTELPAEMIVVGANAIGLELGQLFAHLGSRVTLVEVLDRIAPFEEPEISAALQAHLESIGTRVLTSATITKAGRSGDRRWLDITIAGITERIEADQLVIATGRRADTAGLGLEAARVDTDPRGHVVVDSAMATTNPRVFAAGDVTNLPQFVYVAARSGGVAAEHALKGTGRRIDLNFMPRVTFTSPPIASVGFTEAQAADAGHRVITSLLPLSAVPRALVDHDTTGLVKLVADEATGRMLGAHILAEGAGDVIQAMVIALQHRVTIEEIAGTFHPYLTMAEALKLAAQGFSKDVAHLSCCAA